MDNKKINNICNKIINNINNIIKEGGATIDKDGNASEIKKGYYASVEGMERTISIDNINIEILKNEIIQKLIYINTYKKMFLGFWIDQNTLYIDISKHFTQKRDAINFGIKNNQKAIYNIKDNKSEYITKKVYILYKYIESKNDYKYIMEYKSASDISKLLRIDKKSLLNKINYTIDQKTKLLKNNFCIICESIEA